MKHNSDDNEYDDFGYKWLESGYYPGCLEDARKFQKRYDISKEARQDYIDMIERKYGGAKQ